MCSKHFDLGFVFVMGSPMAAGKQGCPAYHSYCENKFLSSSVSLAWLDHYTGK